MTGGVGSNQYVTRPGGSAVVDPQQRALILHQLEADDPEEVGWAFHPDRELWTAVGLDSWEAVSPWRGVGFEPRVAAEWIRYQIDSADEAQRWVSLINARPVTAHVWKNCGVDTPEEAAEWQQSGFTASGAETCKHAGWGPEESVVQWAAAGFNTDTADLWASYQYTPDTAAEWVAAGWDKDDPSRTAGWRDVDVPAAVAHDWDDRAMSADAYEHWSAVGVTDPTEPYLWEVTTGLTSAEACIRWREAGYTPQIAKFWIDEGCATPDQIPADERPPRNARYG